MKYYSKPPSQLNKREGAKPLGTSKKKISHLILFIDLILVVLVALYFKSDIIKEKTSHIEKQFEFLGLKITSSCKKKIGCHINIDSPDENKKLNQIEWNVFSNIKKNRPIYELSLKNKKIKKGEFYDNTFTFPLELGQTVYISLILGTPPKTSKLQVFP